MTREDVANLLGLTVGEVRKAEVTAIGKLMQAFEASGVSVEDQWILAEVLDDLFDGQEQP
jgi:hypothetical protein